MSKLKIQTIDTPEKYDKKKLLSLKDHRTIIKHWEFIELRTYGNHKWNYYKLYVPNKHDMESELLIYFPDYKKYKKIIGTKFDEEFGSMSWVNLDNIYIEGAHGTIGIIESDVDIKKLDFSEDESKKHFIKYNTIKKNVFLKWVLLIATEESIDSAKYISDNFYALAEKFKIFCRMDMTPAMVMEYFNNKLKDIKEHNIEPIQYVSMHDFYYFLMNPLVNSISLKSALDKLFYLVNLSDFLKGLASGVNWKPSFNKYITKLDDIFNFKYQPLNKDYSRILNNANNFRRLRSNELIIWNENSVSRILDDIKIPTNVIKNYSIIAQSPTTKVTNVTPKEIESYEKLFNKKKIPLLDVQKKYKA